MMHNGWFVNFILVTTLSAVCVLCLPGQAICESSADFTGSFRGVGMVSLNPDQEQLYPNREDFFSGWALRLILDGSLGSRVDYEINIVNDLNYATAPPVSGAFQTGGQVSGSYRHPDFAWVWKDNNAEDEYLLGVSTVDRLNIKFIMDPFEISLGRKPVNLSTCFILTPNDFFQPFSAESYNRIYKPGVDMVRMTWYPGNLSDIGFLAVADYDDHDFKTNQSALLARWVFSARRTQWTIMGGTLGTRDIIAGAFQGEYMAMGLRGEFNMSFPDEIQGDEDPYLQLSAGIDYYGQNNLTLILEYMFRENGAADIEEFFSDPQDISSRESGYLGRHYLALATEYEWHPLIRSDLSAIANLEDSSMLVTGTLLYSLSDESDFLVGGMLSVGKKPETLVFPGDISIPVLKSEYGSYPDTLFIEMKLYF